MDLLIGGFLMNNISEANNDKVFGEIYTSSFN